MAASHNSADQKKWASLQNNAGASLQKIAQGSATSADYQRVSTVLAGLNKLAQQVFDQAVSSAEVQAKKFESQYQKALDSLKLENQDLTPFEKAMNAALKQNNPDLVDSIHEAITLEIYEQSEDLKKDFGGRFSHLKDLLPPKDLPTTDDVLAAQDLLVEKLSALDDIKWGHRSADLLDKIGTLFKDTLREVAEAVQQARSGGRPQLAPPARSLSGGHTIDMEAPAHPLQRAMSMLTGPVEDVDHQMVAQEGDTRSGASGLSAASEGSIQLSAQTEKVIEQAAQDQTSLYSQLADFLKNPGAAQEGGIGGGAGSGQESTEDEAAKADVWWRSFRNWMGDKYDKTKDWNKENKGWLSSLGSLLATMIMDPKLFTNVGQMIGKYLTWDNVKNVAGEAWHMMLDKGKDLVDWVMDKLGLQKVADWGKDKYNKAKDAVKGAKDSVVGAATGAWDKVSHFFGGDDDKKKKGATGTAGPGGASGAAGAAGSAGPGAGSATTSTTNVGGSSSDDSSTTVNNSPTLNVTSGRSTLVPKGDLGGPKTTAVPEKGAQVVPGVTAQAPGSEGIDPATGKDWRPTKGSPQIGLSSFKFHSATDDSLIMMNTSYFTN